MEPVIETVKELEKKLSHIKKPINLSIIGCVVNGPGEAAQTEIGLTGGGQDNNLLYLSGLPHKKVASPDIINKVVELVEEKIKEITDNIVKLIPTLIDKKIDLFSSKVNQNLNGI